MNILPYIRIARPDHWLKNVFIVPGVLLAFYFAPELAAWKNAAAIAAGFVCACLIASSNYVLNEILDAPSDSFHPFKRLRPIPSGQARVAPAYCLWLALAAAGISLAFMINIPFGFSGLLLWVMGLVYNVPPVRLKDSPYVDVLSEAVNNPIRLALGWFAAGLLTPPPLSMFLAYWMFGAFLMAIKRLAEFRDLGDQRVASVYRRSFGWYTDERLLVSIIFYAAFFGMTAGIFIIRYRIELVLATPLVAACMAYYLHIGFRPHSAAQHPENLFSEKKLMALLWIAFLVCAGLLFYDLVPLRRFFTPRIPPPEHGGKVELKI